MRIKPEKKVQIFDVEPWLRQHGFSYEVYDSKGQFSAKLGRYVKNSGMKKGTPDIMGCSPDGLAVYIELKEPRKDHLLRLDQFLFLHAKIRSNAFAVVVSSQSQLSEYYQTFLGLSQAERQTYLFSLLPQRVLIDSKPPKIIDAPIL